MHPFHVLLRRIFWPCLLLPVSVWTFHLAAVMLSNAGGGSDGEAGSRRPLKDAEGGGQRSAEPHERSVPQPGRRAKENAAADRKSASLRELIARYRPAAQKTTVSTDRNKPPSGSPPAALPLPQGGPAAGVQTDSLHHRLLDEAYTLALQSEEPWKNLIAVAREYHRRGDKPAALAVLLTAEKLAVNPDNPDHSSAPVHEVAKAMMSMGQTGAAVRALQNIATAWQRERAMGEVSAWAARAGDMNTAKTLASQILGPPARDVALVAIAESEAVLQGASAAMQTVGLITDKHKRDDAYRRIAMKRADRMDFPGAEQSVALIHDRVLKDRTNASLARIRAGMGDLDGGLRMLRYIGNPVIEDTALRELCLELASLGRFSDGSLVATRIRDDKEKSRAIEGISLAQAKAGRLSAALVSLSSIPLDDMRDRGLRNVSAAAAQRGNPARARNVALRIGSGHERDKAYRAIAQAAAADGNHHVAYNTLQSIAGTDEKALAMVSMARYRLRQGDSRQARALLEDARRAVPGVASSSARDRIRADMALAYAEGDDPWHSLALADEISDQRSRDAALGNLARTLAVNDDIDAAQRSVQSIATENIRAAAEENVARAAARKTEPRQALRKSRELDPGRQRIVFLLEVSRKS